jgi:adenylate cyclase
VSEDRDSSIRTLEEPYPLRRRFRRYFLPGFAGFAAVSLALVWFAASQVIEAVYLELAQRQAQTIARGIAEHAPAAWNHLIHGRTTSELGDDAKALVKAFGDEVEELQLAELKVYDLERKVLFATDSKEIGTRENGAALRDVISGAAAAIVTKTLIDGQRQYELYVPVFDETGTLRLVFELYEPVGRLDDILSRAATPSVAIPALILLLLLLALARLVGGAQAHIDQRTNMLNDLRRRVESFVSATAVTAARHSGPTGAIESRNVTITLFFSDIRDFTGFSEQNSPETVVDFLNRLMTLQVGILQRYGGDVDKMIGDAVLARFDGKDDAARAIAAALDIQNAMKSGGHPRQLGIGIYRGPVISGAIGPENRRDFTVIGDSVNVAARLCSAAGADEIVVDASLADEEFGPVETIQVKGRRESLAVRRWKA